MYHDNISETFHNRMNHKLQSKPFLFVSDKHHLTDSGTGLQNTESGSA